MPVNHGKPYTWKDDLVIHRMAGQFPPTRIADELGRGVKSIRNRAQELGVSLRLTGERHHTARYPDALHTACVSLYDAGIPVARVQQMIVGAESIPYATIYDWCEGRTRTGISLSD